ncbi:MAG: hypothetical protein GY904_32240 [Planctomycetaceae bacterium]|nr:hypothetical protein [Planctomycetaceae bacterium]
MKVTPLQIIEQDFAPSDALFSRTGRLVTNLAECQGGYILSNDIVDTRLSPTRPEAIDFVGIGNPHALHVLAGLAAQVALSRIVLIDNNAWQLRHLVSLCSDIIATNDRFEYVERVLCLKLTDRARSMLLELDSNSPTRVTYNRWLAKQRAAAEAVAWSTGEFDGAAFQTRYDVPAIIAEQQLAIEMSNVGDLPSAVLAICRVPRQKGEKNVFSLCWGQGYLASDSIFTSVRELLVNTSATFVLGDFASVVDEVALLLKYRPVALWSSNVYCQYFVDRHPPLDESLHRIVQQGQQREPNFPELDVKLFEDRRTARRIPQQLLPAKPFRGKRLSNHTRTFRDVSLFLQDGRTGVEVINMESWIKRHGDSNLPWLEYCLVSDNGTEIDERARSRIIKAEVVFFHGLHSHGLSFDRWTQLLQLADVKRQRIIILEHFAETRDRDAKGLGVYADDIRAKLGQESALQYIAGTRCPRRNLLMVYEPKDCTR